MNRTLRENPPLALTAASGPVRRMSMRKTKLAGVLATSGLAVGLLAAPIAEAKPVGPPGQVCKAFLAANPAQTMFTGRNAQGKCASFVARGGTLPPLTTPMAS